MAFITPELKIDEIEDWFKIGLGSTKKKIKPLAASYLGGHIFNPETGGVYEFDKQRDLDSKLPKYKRSNYVSNRQQYVEEFVQKEQEELFSKTFGADGRNVPDSLANELEALELDSTACSGLPSDHIPEGATDVYNNYSFQQKYVELPVLSSKEEIVATIESNQVTIVQGPTGSGKTTQVPQFILDHYATESKYCNIVVTQPRKIAAISIAQRVSDERGCSVGSLCGYQIGLERKVSADTRILYCTTGILKEKLILKKNMHEFTHVILDEVHERDIETDFVLLIIKKLLRTNSGHVKVILMSATFDTQIFANYFAIPLRNKLEPAPIVTIGAGHHRVSEFFADDLSARLGEFPPVDESKPEIHPALYDIVIGLVKEFDLLEEKEQGIDQRTGFAPVRGTVLMFLPGYYEITKILDKIRQLEDTHFILPIPLHSSITLDEQSKAFIKPAKGYRKVIISTNIAESSITVPDIKYVIDFCLTKNLCCDPDTNYTQLQLEWASKANAKQRKGRAGRVSNGRVYYLVPRWFFERVLPDFGTPEMQRAPLENLILKTKIFNMGEPKAILALALSPPNLDDIERTILSLKEVGALSSTTGISSNPHDGDLTFIGKVLADLPVDIRIGKLFILGHVFGVLEECLIIGAALSLKSIFATPMQARLEAYKTKLSWSDNSLSDCIAILNAYKVWENRVKMKEFSRAGATEKQWGAKNFIQIRAIKEVQKLIEELESRLLKFNISSPQVRPSFKGNHTSAVERIILKLVLCGAFYPNYAVKEETDEHEAVKTLSNNDPLKTVMVKGLPINQGILYQTEIREIFKSCWKDPPPLISFEQTRAYIEFPWKQGTMSEGRVHPGVYIAIKIRQLGVKMGLSMYDKEETQKRLKNVQEATASQRSTSDLRTNRMKADNVVGEKQSSYTVTIDPNISTLLLSVTEVMECGHFWAQCDDVNTQKYLTEVQLALNSPKTILKPFEHSLQQGMLVAAPYADGTVQYYRARIEEFTTQKVTVAGGTYRSVLSAVVFYVDYGNTEVIDVSQLKQLPTNCLTQPFLAVEFYLKGIRPSSVRCTDGVWSKQANELFKTWTLNKTLYAQVYSIVNNTVRVSLVARYPNGQEICVNDELIQQEFAVQAEETFLSQQNHEWRESLKTGESSQVQPDSWLQVSVPDNTRPSDVRSRGKKIFLVGPYNPLEMTFSCLTSGGRQLSVKIDPESVNSVAIDDDPQNKYSRLMVSSFIGLNQSGNSMVARNTTILPQIPGLPALVTLVFAPFVEYRTDPKCERYIGALCGLGYDEDNLPILPDHDIALTFETNFGTDDIVMINQVRMAINVALGTEDAVVCWGQDILTRIQETARDKLLTLLKKKREPVTPQNFLRPYDWNLVDPNLVLQHNLTDTEADSDHLLPLHNAIALGCEQEKESTDQTKPSKEYYIKHLKMLKKIAESSQRQPVRCEVCKLTVASSHILAIHLLTERHCHNEALVYEGKFPREKS